MHSWKRRAWLVECGFVCGVVRSVVQCLYRLGSALNLRRQLRGRVQVTHRASAEAVAAGGEESARQAHMDKLKHSGRGAESP